ncbi:putative nucleoredoxin 1-2 isoform X3 [Silene latifolia]|uniref:putative nucleoredoxin 1-2 isoform X3 n=1 Tax=Silene latifolia TaxID=37657 RepID=UPI003D7759FD
MSGTRIVEHSNRKMSCPRNKKFSHWFPSSSGRLTYFIEMEKPLSDDSLDDSSDESSEEESPPKFKKKKPLSSTTDVMKGGHLDVVSFLSNNGKTTHLDDILGIRLDPLYRKRNRVSPQAESIIDSSHDQLPQPPSLYADILLCEPSLVLKRVDPAAGPPMTVSQLCNKHIGLYLCYDGDFMERLNEVHKKCLAMKQELEIVLVSLPMSDDPITFNRNLLEALKLFNITSWFLFPFEGNRMVCRRLWRVFGQHMEYDKLVILPPCNSSQPGEIEARGIIYNFGMNTYPFTASKLIEQRYNALKSLNPVSWFIDSRQKKRTCLVSNYIDAYVCTSKLDGKKLLLYLDSFQFDVDDGEFCCLLMEHYHEIKASGCEVVFVPLDKEYVPIREQHPDIAEMPWPIMPVQTAVKASVVAQLILRGDDDKDGLSSRLIAVGEDGKILSKRANVKLMEEGVTESLFADTLYQEVVHDLTCLKPHAYRES